MHEESGRGDELNHLWRDASDREKIKFLVIFGTPALGIGLTGIIAGNLGLVLVGLIGLVNISVAIAIWRKRKNKKE